MDQPVIPQAIVTWALIIVSVFLVAGITYTYTNRNKLLTGVFTFLTILTVCIIELVDFIDLKLSASFLGAYNENKVGYVVAEPGWRIIFHAWHIWILPVIGVAFLGLAAIISILFYKLSNTPKAEILTPAPVTAPQRTTTRSDRLNTFMAIDAAKKSSQETQQKLAEALLKNASYEVQISDLNLKVREITRDFEEHTKTSTEEIEILELELRAKTKENQYVIDQLSERSRELKRAQEMFEKLMELHKGDKPS
ncbi:MAG: hypothetical protein SFW07_05920 [Gammaproteobacteria bacterium]|nr:hypothetical protein [Gammaproteobacteria bacterium]